MVSQNYHYEKMSLHTSSVLCVTVCQHLKISHPHTSIGQQAFRAALSLIMWPILGRTRHGVTKRTELICLICRLIWVGVLSWVASEFGLSRIDSLLLMRWVESESVSFLAVSQGWVEWRKFGSLRSLLIMWPILGRTRRGATKRTVWCRLLRTAVIRQTLSTQRLPRTPTPAEFPPGLEPPAMTSRESNFIYVNFDKIRERR